MLPKRFDQARPFFTLGVVLAAWVLIPLVIKSFTRISFFELEAPATLAASYVRDLQDFWAMRNASKNQLIEAGRDLARLHAANQLRLQENDSLHAEISRLENLLKLPSNLAYRYEPARIARRDSSGWWQRLIIRKGENYGIKVGSPVVFTGGVVGRISEVYSTTSLVDLIISPRVRLAASIEGDTRPISYQGGINSSFSTARGTVEFVPLDLYASSLSPKRLLTSGLGGIFPPGLALGMVPKLEA